MSMTLKEKNRKLQEVYERFERDAEAFKKDAICRIGCTFCCTDVGNVDTATLEGLTIWEWINDLPPSRRRKIKEKLTRNRLDKEKKNITRCPFLKEDDTCLIYPLRPFSCRQLYSVRECRGRGPTVHREAVELAKAAVREIQTIDDTGYSGHLSFVLHLFDRPDFRKLYLSGRFDPGAIAAFGKTHGLIINRLSK